MDNPVHAYIDSVSPRSARDIAYRLTVVAAMLHGDIDSTPWAALTRNDVLTVRTMLASLYDTTTVNLMLSALRQTLRFAWRMGQMTADEYMSAADIPNMSEDVSTPVGRALDRNEVVALAEVCQDGTLAGVRDSALIGIAYSCGLRRAEIAGLAVDDIDRDSWTLQVHGKRQKVRMVPVESGARRALADWLTVRGDKPGPLFMSILKGGQLTYRKLTTQGIYVIMLRRQEQAGIAHFSPHDMRRTFASECLDAGMDISTLQKLMGHSSADETTRYDRRDIADKAAQVERLSFPYQLTRR